MRYRRHQSVFPSPHQSGVGEAASAHAAKNGGKPWSYALIPDSQITASAALDGLMAKFSVAYPVST